MGDPVLGVPPCGGRRQPGRVAEEHLVGADARDQHPLAGGGHGPVEQEARHRPAVVNQALAGADGLAQGGRQVRGAERHDVVRGAEPARQDHGSGQLAVVGEVVAHRVGAQRPGRDGHEREQRARVQAARQAEGARAGHGPAKARE